MNLHASNAQQNVIDLLNEKLNGLKFEVRNYEKVIGFSKDHAEFYLDMQRKIIADPEIMKAWKIFIAITKMAIDSTEGVTQSEPIKFIS